MSLLCIDTSLNTASVVLVSEGRVIATLINDSQQDHAAWIHNAIQQLLLSSGQTFADIEAVAVASGPGSYTGLRVGMATAKGLCYALGVPLITENTLYLTAMQVLTEAETLSVRLICPMIDARRMEVFTAVYDLRLQAVMEPAAMVLETHSFNDMLSEGRVLFCGNGAAKWKNLCSHSNAVFSDSPHKPENLVQSAWEKWQKRAFADLAYSEPDYFKNFYTGNQIF
jgi:tRNA threonylcarbamoyladenosine biosynthesis protein TsaB